MKNKKRNGTTPNGSPALASVSGSAAPVLSIGAWEAEDIWNRGERCRVTMVALGFLTVAEAMRVRERIDADYAKAQQNDKLRHSGEQP